MTWSDLLHPSVTVEKKGQFNRLREKGMIQSRMQCYTSHWIQCTRETTRANYNASTQNPK